MPLVKVQPKRVFGYVRVSTEEQAKGGHSLDAQVRYIEKWCQDESWPAPTKIFREEGVSGGDPTRPQLNALMHAVRAGDLVLVYHNDRLHRDAEFQLRDVRILAERGVDVRFGNMSGLDPSTPEGKMMLTNLAAQAEYMKADSRRKSELGMEEAHEADIKFGRTPRYFKVVGDELVPSDELVEMGSHRADGLTSLGRRHKCHKRQVQRSLVMLDKWMTREKPWRIGKRRFE